LERIKALRHASFDIVIVTASPTQWVCYWAEDLGAELIATPLEVKEGKISGKLAGINCNHTEKVRRIREKYNLHDFSEIHCYGDSSGDKEMLTMATRAFYRRFS